jgi:SAM-dependent methyltransferase
VSRFWDGLAKAGLDETLAFGNLAKRCIHWIISRHLHPDGRHLDYGAGGGEVAEHLIRNGFAFAIFEPSAERLARTTSRLRGLPGFLGGGTAIVDEVFDTVTCFEVLEHVLDEAWDAVCDALVAHVRPGGKLIVSTPNNEEMSRDTVYCPLSNVTFHRWQHVRRIDCDFLTETFASRGVEKVCVHQLDFIDALYEPYRHMLGHPAPAPSTERYIEEVVPLHIHWLANDIDGVIGGASRILFIGQRE